MPTLKIKTTIATIFSALILLTSGIMIFFQYQSSKEFALLTTKTSFEQVADNSANQIEKFDKSSVEFINIVHNIPLANEEMDISSRHALLPVITSYIQSTPYVYGIYLGFADDSFYIVYNVALSKKMKEALNAPDGSRWLVKKNKKENSRILSVKTYLDNNLNTVHVEKEYTDYRPTERPWYKDALKHSEIVKTAPYVFSALGEPGVTYTKMIERERGVVLSLDITLSSLSELLSNQKLAEESSAFLYKKDGKVLGYFNQINSAPVTDLSKEFPQLFEQFSKNTGEGARAIFDYQGREYIGYTKKINLNSASEDILTILSPLDVVMKPYNEKVINAIFITVIVVLFIIIPLVYGSINFIVKPILKLTKENEKLKVGDFDHVQSAESFMIEISELSKSMIDMAQAIKEKTRNNEKLIEIGYKISSEHDYDLILESILSGAKELSGADGGTLYVHNKKESVLEFKTVMNTSLDIFIGGKKSKIDWPPLRLYDEEGNVNHKNISVISALEDRMICIDDVYESTEFDFTGAKNFDKGSNYRTASMLVVPMKNRDDDLIGVIQLINKIKEGRTVAFDGRDKVLIDSMASLSAMALQNAQLIQNLEHTVEERTLELVDEREFINTILDSQSSIVIVTDGRKIRRVNKAFLKLFDMERLEEFQKDYECIHDAFDADKQGIFIQKVMPNGENWIPYVLSRPNAIHKASITWKGKVHIFDVAVEEFAFAGERLFCATFNDITDIERIRLEVEDLHKMTQDSIEYASLIQHALIPENQFFEKYFSDHFTIWAPRNIVGGDIYLFEELRHDDECILMLVDCTGHGVPGAFVTMLVKAIERQMIVKITNSDEDVHPGQLLSVFNKTIKQLLRQDDANAVSNAGFDGGILYYNRKEQIVRFAGAETPLFLARKSTGRVELFKSDRYSIGYVKSDLDYDFKEVELQIQEGDRIFITTDGFLDQNGGEKGFPFGKKRFMTLLQDILDKDMDQQKELLMRALKRYQGVEEQNDDITLIGLKL